jgi:hypothetical protein
MSGVFLSYRRADTPGEAVHLAERLKSEFGRSRVFIDVDGIEPGVRFEQRLEDALSRSNYVLVLIGKRWLGKVKGQRRIDDENDYVRKEIAAALARGDDVRVIPVLVDMNVDRMPSASQLPTPIAELAGRQAHPLRNSEWPHDISRLLGEIDVPLRLDKRIRRWGRRHPIRATLAGVAAAAAAVLAAALLLAGGTSSKDRVFVRQVEALLERSAPAYRQINKTFAAMDDAAEGHPSMSRSEIEQSLHSVIANREKLLASARGLPARTGPAQRAGDALAAAFSASLTNDRDIEHCLNRSPHASGDVYRKCLKSTADASKAATDSKNHFRKVYNEVRSNAGRVPANPNF